MQRPEGLGGTAGPPVAVSAWCVGRQLKDCRKLTFRLVDRSRYPTRSVDCPDVAKSSLSATFVVFGHVVAIRDVPGKGMHRAKRAVRV